MDSDNFREEITLKLYLKYEYREISSERKRDEKEAFLEVIKKTELNHFFNLNPEKKREYYVFCVRKSNLNLIQEPEMNRSSSFLTFELNKEDRLEILRKKNPEKERFRGKRVRS